MVRAFEELFSNFPYEDLTIALFRFIYQLYLDDIFQHRHCSISSLSLVAELFFFNMAVTITEASMVLLLIVVSICIGSGSGRADALTVLSKDYYKQTCPSAETVIRDTIRNATQFDPKIPARILRMHFHDCFIRVFALYFDIIVNQHRVISPS